MLRLLIILMSLLTVIGILYYIKNNQSASAKQKLILSALISSLLLLILSGKIHWLLGLIAGLIGLARPFAPFAIRYFPLLLKKLLGQHQSQNNSPPLKLTREEALNILGLTEEATQEEILLTYKRLMQKCHPDRGGSDYLATQLNAAKKTLLS